VGFWLDFFCPSFLFAFDSNMVPPSTGKRQLELSPTNNSSGVPAKRIDMEKEVGDDQPVTLGQIKLFGSMLDSMLDAKLKPILEKLELLESGLKEVGQLRTEVEEVKVKMDKTDKRCGILEEKLVRAVYVIKELRHELRHTRNDQEEEENRNRRSNVIFQGIEEESGFESELVLRDKVNKFCTDLLGMPPVTQARTHRLGPRRNNARYPRAVIALIPDNIQQKSIFVNAHKLKGKKGFRVDGDYSERVRRNRAAFGTFRRLIYPMGLRMKIVFDHFFLENKRFMVDRDSGDLLCGGNDAAYFFESLNVDVGKVMECWDSARNDLGEFRPEYQDPLKFTDIEPYPYLSNSVAALYGSRRAAAAAAVVDLVNESAMPGVSESVTIAD